MKTSVLKQKFKDIKHKIRHKLFVFERKWHCHPFFGRFYPKTPIYKRAFALLLALLVLLPGALFYFRPSPTEAAWWDDSWSYRHKFTFIHNAAITSSRLVTFTLDTAEIIAGGAMQTDCDDTRFTDLNGKLLRFQLTGGCNTSATTYAILFPSISNGTNTAYVYYGNPSAQSKSESLGNYWEVPTASYDSKSFDAYTNSPNLVYISDVFFNPDGTKMYISDNPSATVYEYCLSTAWDVTSADYASCGSKNKDVYAQGYPYGIFFTPDGTKMYTAAAATVYEYCLSTAWDVTSADYASCGSKSYDLFNNPPNTNQNYDISFNPDGTKMYLQDTATLKIYEYCLSTAWDVTSADYASCGSKNKDVSGQDSAPDGIFFNPDGTKMYMAGSNSNKIYQYSLSTAGDVSTAAYNSKNFDTSTWDIPISLYFKSDGTKMYMMGWNDVKIYQYSLVTNALYPSGGDPLIADRGSEEKSPAPVLYLKFDEGTGTITKDQTSNGNNGGMRGASWQSQKSCLSENCLYYDGIDDTVIATNAASIDFDQGLASGSAFQAWVKVNSDGENNAGRIFDKGNATYLRTTNEANGKVDLEGRMDLVTTDAMATVSAGLTLNQWHLVTMTYENINDEISLYNDGVLKTTSTTGNGDPAAGDTNNLLIGGQNSKHFNGYIDEFKVYDYARTAAQVKTDFSHIPSSHGKSASIGDEKSFVNDGLVGYWKLDDGVGNPCVYGVATACDSSGNNNTGNWQNGVASTSGKFANAAIFDGTNDRIQIADSSTLNITSSTITLSAWVYPTATADQEIIDKKWDTNPYGYRLKLFNTVIRFEYGDNTDWYTIDSPVGTVTTNTWQLVTATYDGKYVRLYLNGALVQTQARTGSIGDSNTNTLNIGSYINLATTYPFQGKIDDVRIYNRTLSSSEVARLYDWAPPPVGWWKLDENSGGTAYDSSGNGLTGTLTNNPKWTTGKIGSSLDFNNLGYINIGNQSALNFASSSAFSISAWIRRTNTSTRDPIFSKEGSMCGPGYYLEVDGNPMVNTGINSLNFGIYYSQTNMMLARSPDNAVSSVNQWYHVTGTYDGSGNANGIKLFVNGVSLTTSITRNNLITGITNSAPALIGADCSGINNYFTGNVDDVRVYNYVRTPKQIVSDMNAGHPAVGSPVGSAVGYWKFDEGYGTIAHNSGSCATCSASLQNFNAPATYGSGWTMNGKFGKALNFDGTNYDYLDPSIKLSDVMSDQDGSISMWLKPTGSSPAVASANLGAGIIGDTSGILGISRATISGSDRIWLYNSDGNEDKIGITYSTNEWLHVVWVHKDGNLYAYKNGVLVGSIASGRSALMNEWFYIGFAYSAVFYSGSMDEVKIYNYGLSADEVKVDYNQGKSIVLGALSTSADGITASNSAARAYCPPGNGETNCAAGSNPAPVGEWKLDERQGTSAQDTSGNNYTGTFTGRPKWIPGKVGQALKLNGTSDYVDMGDVLDLIGSPLTLEAWVKPYSWPLPGEGIIEKYDQQVPRGNYRLYIDMNGKGNFTIINSSGTNETHTTTGVINKNEWHHIVATYDNATTSNIYIDGKFDSNKTDFSVSRSDTGVPLSIGGYSKYSTYFDGLIDDVRIYNYARTPAQVAWDYNRGGPVGWWKFDECQGTTGYDSSGNGYNQTIVANAGTNTSAGTCNSFYDFEMWNDGTAGKFNASLGLDEVDDYASTSGTIINAASKVTYTTVSWGGWVYPAATGAASMTIVEKNREFKLSTDTNSRPNCAIWTAGGWSTAAVGASALSLSTWQSVVCTYDGANIKVYVNGVQKGTTSQSAAITSLNYTPLTTGASQATTNPFKPTNYFGNQIDDVRVYNYALTLMQVKLLYNDNAAVRFAPLTGSP